MIVDGLGLNDKHIDHGLNLIRNQFPHLSGLQSTLLQQSCHISPCLTGRNALQIIHCRGSHWIVVSTVPVGRCSVPEESVLIYDSLYTTVDQGTVRLLHKMFGKKTALSMQSIQKQVGSKDCGLFALAVSTAVACGVDPMKILFDQSQMRHHLVTCYEKNKFSMFPLLSIQ